MSRWKKPWIRGESKCGDQTEMSFLNELMSLHFCWTNYQNISFKGSAALRKIVWQPILELVLHLSVWSQECEKENLQCKKFSIRWDIKGRNRVVFQKLWLFSFPWSCIPCYNTPTTLYSDQIHYDRDKWKRGTKIIYYILRCENVSLPVFAAI